MKRYYFFTPTKYRNEERKQGLIDFRLDALYSEDAYSDKIGQEVKSFSYFDKIRTLVATRTTGYYHFMFETGKDLALGHYAKSERELLEAYKGSIRISEKNYIRLRKVAIGLMFRHTEFFKQVADGESKYLWCNDTYRSFWAITLTALHYKYNSKGESPETLEYWKERNLPLYDCTVPEEIRLHIAKPHHETKEHHFKCSTFEVTGYKATGRYYDFDDAIKSLKSRNDVFEEITHSQFQRIRKVCKALSFEYSDLEISELKKPQTKSIRILNI